MNPYSRPYIHQPYPFEPRCSSRNISNHKTRRYLVQSHCMHILYPRSTHSVTFPRLSSTDMTAKSNFLPCMMKQYLPRIIACNRHNYCSKHVV